MEDGDFQQGELALSISSFTNSDSRVSCDFTVSAGNGRHIMFYFTELYLGAPNITERVDRACIEPRDINGKYETSVTGMGMTQVTISIMYDLSSEAAMYIFTYSINIKITTTITFKTKRNNNYYC